MNVPQTPGSRLDAHVDRYAARARSMTASEIRALFSVATRPEVVSLAGGMPYLDALPIDAVGEVVRRLVVERGTVAMQYGSAQGDPTLRAQICQVMALESIQADPDDVVVTVGSQQALDLVTRIFINPGDVVVAEAPSYVGALSTFFSYQAEVVQTELDHQGLVPERLEETLRQLRAAGRPVKFVYTIPNFHNPAGVTLSDERRARIIDICREHDVLILEDNPYGLLGFDGGPRRALYADAPDQVVYLGTFSKTFAPGFRVGWAVAPHGVREKLVLASEAAVLCPPAFSQLAVSTYLANEPWQQQIKTYQELYRERRDTMLACLDDLMPPGVSWTRPGGGFYVWVDLPDGLDAKAMLGRAVTARVAYVPGTAFFADGRGRGQLRLSYCYPGPERIREGVRRLAGVLEAELELHSTFGTGDRSPREGVRPGTGGDQADMPSPDLA